MDCPICASAKGLKDRQDLVQHMEVHRNDPDLMIEKIAGDVHESYNEITANI